MLQDLDQLDRIIKLLAAENGRKLVLVHHNAEPDAVGAAVALRAVFPRVDIAAPLGLNRVADRLVEVLGVPVLARPDPGAYDEVVILDTSSAGQLGPYAPLVRAPIVIDHHEYGQAWPDAKVHFVDASRTSVCEIVYDLLDRASQQKAIRFHDGENVDVETLETVGLALLVGIYTDTAGFRRASPPSLQSFARILSETGRSMDDVLDVVDGEPGLDRARKLAHLKAAQRLRVESLAHGEIVVAISHVGSYEASAAKGLTLLGADVTFVLCQRGRELRLSARARPEVLERFELHLGRLMSQVGAEKGLQGGGHAGAAGLNGYGEAEDALKACLAKLRRDVEKAIPANGAASPIGSEA